MSLAGMTADETAAVVGIAGKLMGALPDGGVEILIAWFAADKDAQTKFKMFAGKSADELRASPRAAAHATKIFSSFQTLLICRNKPAAVQELLNDLKRDHTTRHVAKANIDALATAIVNHCTKAFGKDDNAISGLGKLMNLIGQYTIV
jgi:hypothetical protein